MSDPRDEFDRVQKAIDASTPEYERRLKAFQHASLEVLDKWFDIQWLLEEPQRTWFATQQKAAFDFGDTPENFAKAALKQLARNIPQGAKND